MTRHATSLLSLPDELLVEIFDFLAVPLRGPRHPLVAALTVCRRVHNVAKPLLYCNIILSAYMPGTAQVEAAIQRNPSLGRLVSTLELYDYGSFHDGHGDEIVPRKLEETLRAFSKLSGLTVSELDPDEAASILAALPSAPLRYLDLQLTWTEDPSQWQNLRTCLCRLSGLRVLKCEVLDGLTLPIIPRAPRHAAQEFSLPELLELRMADYLLLDIIKGAGPLRQVLPSLQALHITVSRAEDASAISTCLSEAPWNLAKLSITAATSSAVPRGWLSTLPAVRCLEIGPGTFVELDLLAYLETATTLDSIGFTYGAKVTDQVLRALTGPERPPRLRHIRLDHVDVATPKGIAAHLAWYEPADMARLADDVRSDEGPHWPIGGTEQGLQRALGDANANGIRVTGHALGSIGWHVEFDRLLVDRMMEQAHETDDYADVIARFGGDIAVAWLEDHAPERIPLLRTRMSALQLDDVV